MPWYEADVEVELEVRFVLECDVGAKFVGIENEELVLFDFSIAELPELRNITPSCRKDEVVRVTKAHTIDFDYDGDIEEAEAYLGQALRRWRGYGITWDHGYADIDVIKVIRADIFDIRVLD